MKNYKIPVIIFAILYLVLGLLDLISGADADSRFFYFDNWLIRFIGIVLIISSIGLFLRKEIARKGIIVALSLSLIEILIGIPRNMDITEFVIGLILFLILYVPGLLFFISPENKLWNKIFGWLNRNKKIKINEETETIEDKVKRELVTSRNIKNGASWFYWIAGLSIINTIVVFFDGNLNFVVGLGLIQLVDNYAYIFSNYFGMTAIICGIVINLIIAGIFIYFGIMANKCKKWSFIIGMILYGLDAIIFIIFQDFFGIIFHLFALIFIFNGFKTLNKANELNM
ncbi:hypothetical protein [Clostridium pasteurianum]|uniref:Uncharacterized protein n=1 Tax=Clostridium pasteurianum BC1 TaxID=86416 RepID=R4KBH0_CLOPA|nr:hypothetical protein [Clostridium pasteurianum]AGK96980.1 hypothetical protein Clopa_2098 [Clostridium pasteurianum BC1]